MSNELLEASSEVRPGGRTEVTALELFEQLQHLDEGSEASPNAEVIELASRLVAEAAETRRDRVRPATELQAAVDQLPRDQRLMLRKHVQDDMTFRQIAQELRIPAEIVLELLGSAYSTLRLRLGDAEEDAANHRLSGK